MLYTQTSLSLVYNLERVSKSLQCYSATYQFGIVAWLRLEPNSYSTKLYSLHRRCSFGPVAVALGQLSESFVLSAAFLLLGVVCQCTSPMYRLRCDVWRTIFVPKLCLCGQTVSPYHAIFKCPALAGHFKPIADKLRLLNPPPDLSSLCRFRDDAGWGLAVDTTKLIFNSGVAAHI